MIDFGTLFSGFGAGMRAVSAYSEAKNAQASLTAQAQVATNNALITEWQADDAEMRGAQAADVARQRGAQVKGSQRAALAASNVDLSVGSAQNVLNDTDYLTALDSAQLVNNASREAWGYRMQGRQYAQQATAAAQGAAQVSPWLAAGTSLLSSATPVASRWYANSGASRDTTSTTRAQDGLSSFLASQNNYADRRV